MCHFNCIYHCCTVWKIILPLEVQHLAHVLSLLVFQYIATKIWNKIHKPSDCQLVLSESQSWTFYRSKALCPLRVPLYNICQHTSREEKCIHITEHPLKLQKHLTALHFWKKHSLGLKWLVFPYHHSNTYKSKLCWAGSLFATFGMRPKFLLHPILVQTIKTHWPGVLGVAHSQTELRSSSVL